MSNLSKRPKPRRKLKGKPVGFLLVILFWSLAMGWLLAIVTNVQGTTPPPTAQIGTVDAVPQQFQLGQQLYIENCSTCHIALPPAVFPTQTWRNLLQDSQHYGTLLKPLIDPPRILVWRYLSTFSRPQLKDEDTPYRLDKSRFFKALHPKVKIPRPITMGNCVTCHPGATQYNFRNLTPEWENAE